MDKGFVIFKGNVNPQNSLALLMFIAELPARRGETFIEIQYDIVKNQTTFHGPNDYIELLTNKLIEMGFTKV